MTRGFVFFSLIMSFTAVQARADGFYIGIHGGAVAIQDADTAIKNTGQPTIDSELHTNTGWAAGAAAGYIWPIGLALEGEITYRENEMDKISLLGGHIDLGGNEHSLAFMANGYYRLNTGMKLTPYLGVGIGAATLTLDARAQGGGSFEDSDTVLAYQAIAGVSYALSERFDLGLEYRYFATTDPEWSDSQGGTTTQLDSEYRSHNVMLRLIYHLH